MSHVSRMHSETNYNHRYRGVALIYGLVFMTIFAILCTFASDYGRVQMADAELQRLVDAAARAGASGIGLGTKAVNDRARMYADENHVDAGSYDSLVIESGKWNENTRQFTKLTGFDQGAANAVRVTATRTVPLSWGKLLSDTLESSTVRAEAIAFLKGGKYDLKVHPKLNPYLAGMPDGVVTLQIPPGEDPDYGDTNFVAPVQGIPIYGGGILTFDSITGRTQNDPNNAYIPNQGPDGESNRIFRKYGGIPEFGIASLEAPANSLIGVFLTDERPDLTAAPEALDYKTSSSRNKTSYTPKLKQPFFIGDGLTNQGEVQQFHVPQGATRLFLASMDEYEWNNNKGEFQVKGGMDEKIHLVK